MKYYKESKKQIVTKYKIVKLGCDYCKKDIMQGTEYFILTEYPKYPEDSIDTTVACLDCLKTYLLTKYLISEKRYNDDIKIECTDFFEDEINEIEYSDRKLNE